MMKKIYGIFGLVFVLVISLGLSFSISADGSSIPSWIKNTALWWGQGNISDDDFLGAMQFLIKEGILVIPEQSQVTSTSTQSSTNVSLEDLLPNRDDVGTEWKISELLEKNAEEINAVKGLGKKFTKGSVFFATIYEYNSASDAKEHYDVSFSEVKHEGGYKEIQFSHSGSECYGTIEDFQIKERIRIRCINSNYYVLSSVVSDIFDFDAEENIKKFAKIMLNKIP